MTFANSIYLDGWYLMRRLKWFFVAYLAVQFLSSQIFQTYAERGSESVEWHLVGMVIGVVLLLNAFSLFLFYTQLKGVLVRDPAGIRPDHSFGWFVLRMILLGLLFLVVFFVAALILGIVFTLVAKLGDGFVNLGPVAIGFMGFLGFTLLSFIFPAEVVGINATLRAAFQRFRSQFFYFLGREVVLIVGGCALAVLLAVLHRLLGLGGSSGFLFDVTLIPLYCLIFYVGAVQAVLLGRVYCRADMAAALRGRSLQMPYLGAQGIPAE